MFSPLSEFYMWNNKQIEEECAHSAEMSCAQLNENMFKKHKELENKALDQVSNFVNAEIQKKHDKEQKLKQFVLQANDLDDEAKDVQE